MYKEADDACTKGNPALLHCKWWLELVMYLSRIYVQKVWKFTSICQIDL